MNGGLFIATHYCCTIVLWVVRDLINIFTFQDSLKYLWKRRLMFAKTMLTLLYNFLLKLILITCYTVFLKIKTTKASYKTITVRLLKGRRLFHMNKWKENGDYTKKIADHRYCMYRNCFRFSTISKKYVNMIMQKSSCEWGSIAYLFLMLL